VSDGVLDHDADTVVVAQTHGDALVEALEDFPADLLLRRVPPRGVVHRVI
jgi:hypothetical protein